MSPSRYQEYLENTAVREGLDPSRLRPCSSVDILSLEREVGTSLPESYVDFVCMVGVGEEHGGLATWLHLDLTRPGNVVACSKAIEGEQLRLMRERGRRLRDFPKGLLIIYDANDGGVYGFVPNSGSTFQPHVVRWDCEEHRAETVALSFTDFLAYLASEYAPGAEAA